METIEYKGFIGSVEVSVIDKCIHGKILFISDLVTYEAKTIDNIENEFKNAVDDYIETCKESGVEALKSLSGTFNVRVGNERHLKAVLYGIKNDLSLNAVVGKALDSYLDKSHSVQEIHNHTHQIIINKKGVDLDGQNDYPKKDDTITLTSRVN